MIAVPKNKPALERLEIAKVLNYFNVNLIKYPIVVVGIQGYYLDSIGEKGKNDINVYDDGIFLVTPNIYAAYNGNTDPSKIRKGSGFGASKGMAHLKPNNVYYAHQLGLHKGKYEALVQTGGKVTVIRDGNPNYEDTGMFGINMHMGYYNSTSSEGCQTVYKPQYESFITNTKTELKRVYGKNYKQKIVPYVLVEETFRRKNI